jgi:hypothetical protein
MRDPMTGPRHIVNHRRDAPAPKAGDITADCSPNNIFNFAGLAILAMPLIYGEAHGAWPWPENQISLTDPDSRAMARAKCLGSAAIAIIVSDDALNKMS